LHGKYILEAHNIVSGYGRIQILDEVSVSVSKGSITALIGPNGSGKSTLLKAIYGLIPIWAGVVSFDERNVTGMKPSEKIRIGISYLAQRRSVFPLLTVEENLKMGVWMFRGQEETVRNKIEEVYQRFPLLEMRRTIPAGALSGGEQRMLELGRTLMTNPHLIILDEFSAGMAPKVAIELYDLLVKLRDNEGISMLAVDQNVKQIVNMADYVYVLKLGKVREEGFAAEINKRLDEVIADWLRA